MWEPVVSGDGECDGQLMLPHVELSSRLPKAEKTAWLCRGPWRLFWCWVKFSDCENNTSGSSNLYFSQMRT